MIVQAERKQHTQPTTASHNQGDGEGFLQPVGGEGGREEEELQEPQHLTPKEGQGLLAIFIHITYH